MAFCKQWESLYEVTSNETFLTKHSSGNHAAFVGFDTGEFAIFRILGTPDKENVFLVFTTRLYCFVAVETLESNVACAAVWDSTYLDHFPHFHSSFSSCLVTFSFPFLHCVLMVTIVRI